MNLELRLTNVYCDGDVFPCADTEHNDNGEILLGLELKERIEKIRRNIEACGSYEKLIEVGGEATRKYLLTTRNMLRYFLFYYQVDYLITTGDDLRFAADAVNTSTNIEELVRNASWDDIESYAETLRESFGNVWFERVQKRNAGKLAA